MTRDEAKILVRTEPTVQSTFDEVDAEFQSVKTHLAALKARRDELEGQLRAIAVAKAELQSTGELAPEMKPAAKPKGKGN